MKLFEEIQNNSNTVAELHEYLDANMHRIYDLINGPSAALKSEIKEISYFLESKRFILEKLDYSTTQEKAFISILFDICERFGLIETVCIENALQKQGLHLGLRREAAKLFLLNVRNNDDYINRFDSICELLQNSIDEEEATLQKPLITFSNYYAKVVGDASFYADELINKIRSARESHSYEFLMDPFVHKLLLLDVSNPSHAYEQIKLLQDELSKDEANPPSKYSADDCLIEEDTDYVKLLKNVSDISFSKIREIALQYGNSGKQVSGHGVNPLLTEEDLFLYLRNYGPMHQAKLLAAFSKFPYDKLNNQIEIIDWGCGQGLATFTFIEYLRSCAITLCINKITLIEPSELALRRAAFHLKLIDNSIRIKTVCKFFNELDVTDVMTTTESIKIHLFSNILDIEEDKYSQSNLIKIIEGANKNLNYFICVSPYHKDVNADRVDEFNRHFKRTNNTYESYHEETVSKKPTEKYWNCVHHYKNNTVHDYHDEYGCNNKWTKVIRVFSVTLD